MQEVREFLEKCPDFIDDIANNSSEAQGMKQALNSFLNSLNAKKVENGTFDKVLQVT